MEFIRNYKELNHWLEKNNYFEDGQILQIDLNPLVITIGYMIEGNYVANTEKSILSFKITPHNILEWTFSFKDCIPSEDCYIECITALEVDKCVALELMLPPSLLLVAESLTISDSEIVKTTFKPWISPTYISVKAPIIFIPRPDFWIEKLQNLGHDVKFRYFSGEGKQPEQIPYPNYSGYFIQLTDNIRDSQMGIFIESLLIQNDIVIMSFSNRDRSLDNVWTSMSVVLADLPHVEISCGNCKFTGEEWKQLLKDKQYPQSNILQ